MKTIRFSAWLLVLLPLCWANGNAQTGLANCSYADVTVTPVTINKCPLWPPTFPFYAYTYQNVYSLTVFCENLNSVIYWSGQPFTVNAQGVCEPPFNCAPWVVGGPGPDAPSVPGTNQAEYDVQTFWILVLGVENVCFPGPEADNMVGCPAQSCQDCNSVGSSNRPDALLESKKIMPRRDED
jgi:hypothetical protein